jgi:methylmalonyl-CoA/ethylmalonyl-CoA epimerase
VGERLISDAKVDHVAIAVYDVARAIPIYADVFGARYLFGGDNARQGFRWAQFEFPNGGKIEFVAPLVPDGFVARFLAARGEGVHHVTFKTADISAALAELRAGGLDPIMVNVDHEAWKEAFVHPKQALGVLIQVAQSVFSDEEVARHHLSDHSRSDHRHLAFEELGSGR